MGDRSTAANAEGPKRRALAVGLATALFFAPFGDVGAATLAFTPEMAPLAHRNRAFVKDASRDGIADLLGHFRME